MAHCLELAVRDATAFDTVDDLLLKLYYESLKECSKLEDIISDLKECFSSDDNGLKPVHVSGSRWVAHKLNAINRLVSNFGAI